MTALSPPPQSQRERRSEEVYLARVRGNGLSLPQEKERKKMKEVEWIKDSSRPHPLLGALRREICPSPFSSSQPITSFPMHKKTERRRRKSRVPSQHEWSAAAKQVQLRVCSVLGREEAEEQQHPSLLPLLFPFGIPFSMKKMVACL